MEGCLTGNCPLAGGSLVALGDLSDEYVISHTAFCSSSFPEKLTRIIVQGKGSVGEVERAS